MKAMIDKTIPAFNTRFKAAKFLIPEALYRFADEKKIKDRQEFYFVIDGGDILFSSIIEYIYEG